MNPPIASQNSAQTFRIADARAAASERRRRPRMHSSVAGFLWLEHAEIGEEPWEVRIDDLSKLGIGFTTTEALAPGALCRIRIGRGPMRLARAMKITYCKSEGALFRVGAEFA